jgi:hypothetical protein
MGSVGEVVEVGTGSGVEVCTKRGATGRLAKREGGREDIPRVASAGRSAARATRGGQPRLDAARSDMNGRGSGEDASVWFPRTPPA